MDVLGNGIAGDFLKLMGQIKGIHVDAFGKFLQGEVVHVMGMDIIGYGIYSFGQTILRVLCLVDIAVLVSASEYEIRNGTGTSIFS